MGFIFWNSVLVENPIHELKTPKTKLELGFLGTKFNVHGGIRKQPWLFAS